MSNPSLPHFWPISWGGRWVGVVGGGGGPVGLTPSPLPRTTVLTTVSSWGVLLKEKCKHEMINLILHNRYLWTISKRIAVRDSAIARRINYCKTYMPSFHTKNKGQNSYKGFNQNQGKPGGIIHCCASVCFCFDLWRKCTVQTIALILVIFFVWVL